MLAPMDQEEAVICAEVCGCNGMSDGGSCKSNFHVSHSDRRQLGNKMMCCWWFISGCKVYSCSLQSTHSKDKLWLELQRSDGHSCGTLKM